MINTFLTNTGIVSSQEVYLHKTPVMKKESLRILATAALILVVMLPASAQGRAQKKEQAYRDMLSLIEEGQYTFTVQSVNPTGVKTIHPSSIYTFEARDSAYSTSLPYFGRAYQASYGGDGGIEFDGVPEELKFTTNDRKRQATIAFTIKSDKDQFQIRLTVGSSGYGTLYITPVKRQHISYYGQVGPSD